MADCRRLGGSRRREYIDSMLHHLPTWLWSAWPGQCQACYSWPSYALLCRPCLQRFSRTLPRCSGCGLPLPFAGERCGRCLRLPPPWTHCYTAADYVYPWAQILARWKFQQQAGLTRPIAVWLLQQPALAAALQAADLLIPVPLSSQRLRERGFNPASSLAGRLAPGKNRPHLLLKLRHTPAQSSLPRTQRLSNLRGAYGLAASAPALLAGRKIVLIDDILTTGATFRACTGLLLAAGASQVSVLAVARTP